MVEFPIHSITEKDPQRKEFSVPPVEDKNPGIQENTQVSEEGRAASPPLPESDPSVWRRSLRIIAVMFTPINTVIAISLVVALVKPLKSLFVDISGVDGPSWAGPDGNPPLSFIIDTG